MLINLSNHPSQNWESTQLEEASEYGKIIDIPFPNIPSQWDTQQIERLAKEYFNRIKEVENTEKEKPVIHIAGEPVFCFLLINRLLKYKYQVLTSTSERISEEEDGVKKSTFKFERFRRYTTTRMQPVFKRNIRENRLRFQWLICLIALEFFLLALLDLIINSELCQNIKEVFYNGSCNFIIDPRSTINILFLPVLYLSLSIILFCHLRKINRKAVQEQYNFKFTPESAIKLFTNAIHPQYINLAFLIIFLIHIGCLGNIAYSLFIASGCKLLFHIIYFFIILAGGAFLIYAFPRPTKGKKNAQKIFFSGLSTPFFDEKKSIEEMNLYPLVRELFVITNSEKNILLTENDKLHILLSTETCKNLIKNIEKIPSKIIGVSEHKEAVEILNNNLHRIKNTYIQNDMNEENINNALRDLIRTIGSYAFYGNNTLTEIIRNIEIIFSIPVNYNSFEDCYSKAEKTLDDYENEYDIIINSTPGTVTLTSALALLSMKGNRRLLYYNQDSSIPLKYRMTEIIDNKLNFKDLIERISEELSNEDE